MPAKESFVTPELNLLPEEDLESKPGGRFLKWALSWGKKIVILTELLVVLAFLSRFKFDSDVATNSEEIDRRKTIILASADFERQFRSVQERLKKVGEISNRETLVTVYDRAKALIPAAVTLTEITLTGDQVSFSGSGADDQLTLMVAAFKGSTDFENVILEKVSKHSGTAAVQFSLTAFYIGKKT